MLNKKEILNEMLKKVDLIQLKQFIKGLNPAQLLELFKNFDFSKIKNLLNLKNAKELLKKVDIMGYLNNNFNKLVGLIYWIIFGEKMKQPFVANKNAYFIHAYKIRKETKTYSGLNVSADLTVEALKRNGFKAEGFGFHDDNGIDKVLFDERPTHLIIKAFWVRKEKLEMLAKRYPSCQFIVVCHSKPSFLASENSGFVRFHEVVELSRVLPNVKVAANNEDMAIAMENAYKQEVVYLPNLIEITERKPSKEYQNVWGNVLKVGIFCAVRPMKNIMTQALAAISYCKENDLVLELHVLSGRTEMEGDVTIKNLRDLFSGLNSFKFKLIEHPWLNHEDFIELVETMDIGLQVSFTESFNIVTIDLLSCGIPVVTSPAIAWTPTEWQANPDNISEIKNKMKQWLIMKEKEKENWMKEGEDNLKEYNYSALEIYNKLAENGVKW